MEEAGSEGEVHNGGVALSQCSSLFSTIQILLAPAARNWAYLKQIDEKQVVMSEPEQRIVGFLEAEKSLRFVCKFRNVVEN